MMLAGRTGSKTDGEVRPRLGEVLGAYAAELFGQEIMETFVPVFPFVEADMDIWRSIMEEQISVFMPIYHFCGDENQDGEEADERLTLERILWEEAQEHATQEETNGQETPDEGTSPGEGETPDTDEKSLWSDLLLAENEAAAKKLGNQDFGTGASGGEVNEGEGTGNGLGEGTGENSEEIGGDLPQAPISFTDFIPHAQVSEVDLGGLKDYQTLVQSFYTIDSSTMIGSDQLDVDKLSSKDMSIDKSSDGPQILIYHTHSQEAFADSVNGDRSTTIVGVGDYLTQILTEVYGYQVLHHDGEYDVPSRDKAYSVALPAVTKLLEENPTIEVVIDLHRDAIDEKTHLVTEIDGRPTARFMFFNGLSRTRKTGNISYLYNANLDDNLAFSFQLQKKAMEYYPGLTRRIYLKAYRYNMHLRPRNLLIELGAQNNTVEEAMNACDPLAHILDMVLSGE